MGQTLIYKRTHTGDPNTSGVFGCHDCMGGVRGKSFEGKVRGCSFDAVIGVGGKRPDRGSEDIAGRINWIGISPTRTPVPPDVRKDNGEKFRGDWLTFECFRLWEETGPHLKKYARSLSEHLFEDNKHFVMSQFSSPRNAGRSPETSRLSEHVSAHQTFSCF